MTEYWIETLIFFFLYFCFAEIVVQLEKCSFSEMNWQINLPLGVLESNVWLHATLYDVRWNSSQMIRSSQNLLLIFFLNFSSGFSLECVLWEFAAVYWIFSRYFISSSFRPIGILFYTYAFHNPTERYDGSQIDRVFCKRKKMKGNWTN